MQTKDLGYLLISKGLASELAVRQAEWLVRHKGGSLLEHVLTLGETSEEQLAAFLAEISHVPRAQQGGLTPDASLSTMLPPELIKNNPYIVPLKREGRDIWMLVADIEALGTLKDLEFATDYHFRPLVATFNQVRAGREALYPSLKEESAVKPAIQLRDYTRERFNAEPKGIWRFEESDTNLDIFVNTALMEARESQRKPAAAVWSVGQQKRTMRSSTLSITC